MKKKRININKNVMKKSNFLQGTIVATFAIVFTKILGILYVIPFNALIGEKGGALYGYAYNLYLIFISISSAGIPLAISKLISEYQAQGFYKTKDRVFKLGVSLSIIFGIVLFLILFLIAPIYAKSIIGSASGGNSVEDITRVIRIISMMILVVPILSIYRGYFEGHRFIKPSALSQVIEQTIRILIVVFGSFIAIKVFKTSISTAVNIAVYGATIGLFLSYIYLFIKKKNNNSKFREKQLIVKEPRIKNKEIIKKIIIYSIPLIMIDIFKSLYSIVDSVTVVKKLDLVYKISDAEAIYAVLSAWGTKFNVIIIAIATGIMVSLTPSLTSSYVVGDKKEIDNKINKSFQLLGFIVIPLTIMISFLAKPIYTLFYGISTFGPSILSLYIFVGLMSAYYTMALTITQILKHYKVVFISLISGLLLKILINTSLMIQLYSLGLPMYYGAIFSSILGYGLSTVICMIFINRKENVNYEKTVNNTINIIIGSFIMILTLTLLKIIVPLYFNHRILNLFIIIIYMSIGTIIYLYYMHKSKTITKIFGYDIFRKIKRKIKGNANS